MPHFLYLFKPKRENFAQTMSPKEQAVMADHTHYLSQLHADDALVLAGPCLDGAFALNVFACESADVAQQIFANDPAVQAELVHAELHPFHVSFLLGHDPTPLNV